MTIAVGSNDCLSGLKRQNNSLQSPSRASSNGGKVGSKAREHKLTENAERSGGKVEHEAKYFVTLHRERKRWPPNLCSTTRPAPAVMTRGKDPGT